MVRTRSGARGERQVNGGEIRDGDQFGEGLQLAARFGFQFADRRVVAEGHVAGARGGGESADGAVAQEHHARVQGRCVLDAVAEEVVGVGCGGESAGEQGVVRVQGLGQFGDGGRGAGQFGEGGGEAAAGVVMVVAVMLRRSFRWCGRAGSRRVRRGR